MSSACGSDRPARWSSSTTSSNDAESLTPGVQMGTTSSSWSPKSGESSSASRARIQSRFPRIVLISPLCAMNRNGCASDHEGNVLVENLECTITIELSTHASLKSEK